MVVPMSIRQPSVGSYYVLDWTTPLAAERHTLEVAYPARGKRWKAGHAFTAANDDDELQPPVVAIEVRTSTPSGRSPHVYPEYTSQPIPLMTRRLVAALEGAGVGNLQLYQTSLIDALGAPPPPPDHYLAVNIVGRVAAADLASSTLGGERATSMDFHSLTIDEARARGALLFRLAENPSAVLAHASVRAHVVSCGIDTLTWLAPEEWAG